MYLQVYTCTPVCECVYMYVRSQMCMCVHVDVYFVYEGTRARVYTHVWDTCVRMCVHNVCECTCRWTEILWVRSCTRAYSD